MKRLLILMALLLLLFSGCGKDNSQSDDVNGVSRSELLLEHNRQRGLNKVYQQLWQDSDLNKRAQDWAEYMASHRTFRHSKLGGTQYGWMGENIAMGQPTISSVMHDWMHSPGHRANILNQHYSNAGFGVAKDKNGTLYWVVQFGGH